MTQPAERSLYEILDVPAEASAEEIDRAYRIAVTTYQPGSAATYSVFSDEESAEILREVEQAFSVLSDPRKRREYDASRRTSPAAPRAFSPPPAPRVFESGARPGNTLRVDVEVVEPDDGIYDGVVLHRIRVSRGIELEEICSVTKINQAFLRYIEANRYELLPAPVYVKGFVREIARALRLDPARVADTYMQRYREHSQRG